MKNKLKANLLLGSCLLFASHAFAQEATLSSGNEISSSSGSLSESVGQVFYTEKTGPNNNSSEGVQQPFEIQTITSINEANLIELAASVYPNPTSDMLNLSIDQSSFNENLIIRLFDLKGQMLEEQRIQEQNTPIHMAEFSNSAYLLKVYQNNQEIKVFKIIKN